MSKAPGWQQKGDERVFVPVSGVTARVVRLGEDRWGGGIVIEAPGSYGSADEAQSAVEDLFRHLAGDSGGSSTPLAAEF